MNDADKLYLRKMKKELVDNCPKCHGTEPFCSCAYALRNEIRKIASNIPMEYRGFTLDKFVHPELEKEKLFFKQYLKTIGTTDQRDLLITGTRGVGKTALAILALMTAIQLGKKVYYFHTFKRAMELSYSDNAEERELLDTADLIVIDSIGTGFIRETTNGTESLKSVLTERKILGKHIIFVSSLPYANLAGADKEVIKAINPSVLTLVGFDYKKEVLHDYPLEEIHDIYVKQEQKTKKETRAKSTKKAESVEETVDDTPALIVRSKDNKKTRARVKSKVNARKKKTVTVEPEEYVTVDKEGKPL